MMLVQVPLVPILYCKLQPVCNLSTLTVTVALLDVLVHTTFPKVIVPVIFSVFISIGSFPAFFPPIVSFPTLSLALTKIW